MDGFDAAPFLFSTFRPTCPQTIVGVNITVEATSEGLFSPSQFESINEHWEFLPAFAVEVIPRVDLALSWTFPY